MNENLNYEFVTNDFKIDENKNIITKNNCWFLFKKSRMKDIERYKIEQGDIIRFGRIAVRVKDIKITKNINLNKSINFNFQNNINNNILNDKMDGILTQRNEQKNNPLIFSSEMNSINPIKLNRNNPENMKMNNITLINVSKSIKKFKNKTPKICRICFLEEDPLENFNNPLVQPCKCSGSLKYIHLNCLKHWLNTKSCNKQESNKYFSMFLVNKVECEICKSKFPDFVKHKDKLYEILDFQSEFDNYMTMESLTIDKNNNRCLYVINLDNNIKIKIGRGHDADLILSDISVSRVHSILTIVNRNIFLEDNNSKFGTLIMVQSQSLKLVENLPLYVQIGRTFLECNLKTSSSSLFSCCGVSEKSNYNTYFQQNEKQINICKIDTIKSEIDFSDDYENDEKNFNKLNTEENDKRINLRYEDITLDHKNINNSILQISKDEKELGFNSMRKSKSLFFVEENKNNDIESKEERKINKSQSIILENEGENKKEKNTLNKSDSDSIILESEN